MTTDGASRATGRLPRALVSLVVLAASACGDGADGVAVLEPTFSGGVARIIYQNCATCHRPGGAGPFSLLTYEQVRARGRRVVEATASGHMPPWRPARPVGVFAGERGLSVAERDLLRRWVDGGMPPGDPAQTPAPPEWSDGWQLGVPDLVLEMPAAYTVPAGGGELFRNFVLPVSLDSARWIRAAEFKPGSPRVVHHATLAIDRTGASRDLDLADAEPGFDGMGSAGGAEHPSGFFIGWTPGKAPNEGSEGLSWRLEPGTDAVARLHVRPIDEPVQLSPTVGLYFAQGPPRRPPVTVQLGVQALDIPAGVPAYEAQDSFYLPVAVDVLSIYPHAHYLGDIVQAWAETPDGGRVWLLEIPEWDFNWQDEYRFRAPLALPAGSVIRMRYTYDNTVDNELNPSDPPVRVTYGSRSVDEMADLIIQALPTSADGSALLQRAVERKVAEIKLGGYRLALDLQGEDAQTRYNMGIAEASLGRQEEAERQFRSAIRMDAGFAEAYLNLGIVLQQQGRGAEAMDAYARAAQAAPRDARPHHNTGVLLQAVGRAGEAEAHLRRAIELDPTFALSHKRLAQSLRARGDFPGAVQSYRESLELDARDPEAHMELGLTHLETGDAVRAVESLRAAAAVRPDWPQPLLALAELIANHPDPAVRQPLEAIRLAQRAVELTRRGDALAHAILATAFAAAGDFRQATQAGEEALAVARQNGATALAQAVEARLARYRSGQR